MLYFFQDFRPCEIYATEYLVDSNQLGFLVADSEMNLVLFMYQPDDRESFGGQRLIRKADFNVGQHINTFFRIKCRLGNYALEYDDQPGIEKRHITMYGE